MDIPTNFSKKSLHKKIFLCFYFLIREKITKFAVKLSFYALGALTSTNEKRIYTYALHHGAVRCLPAQQAKAPDIGAVRYIPMCAIARRPFQRRAAAPNAYRQWLYEYAGASPASHHHLICTVCGRIKEMRDAEVDALINSKHYPAFSQTSFTLNIYGECRSCQNQRRRA